MISIGMSVLPIEAAWWPVPLLRPRGLWHTLILIGRTDRHCNFLPLQRQRNLLDLTALLHLEELDISEDRSPGYNPPFHFHFSNADCLKLAELTTLQTLHIDYNAPINDSGFKVRTFPPVLLSLHRVTGLDPFIPGLPLHSRHMRSCVKVVCSTLTMKLAALKPPSQQFTRVSPPCNQGQRLHLCSPVSILNLHIAFPDSLSFGHQGLAAEAAQVDFSFADFAHNGSSLKHYASFLEQALLSMPRLRTLHCNGLGLADWQYAEYKNRYLGSIRMIARSTEHKILDKHRISDGGFFSTQREREELFLRYQELLAAPPA